jgi:serine/threonine protein kinase
MTMEYCENGDFLAIIKNSGKLSNFQGLTQYYFHQLLDGVEHIHS